jgi:hypothetical protein
MLAGLVSSPARMANFFRRSRDSWKKRSLKYQERIKALDGKVRDLERSRDKWKAEAKESQRELDTVRRQFGDVSAKTDELSRGQAAPAGRALIVAPSTGLAPAAATAAPPFCQRSSTAIR